MGNLRVELEDAIYFIKKNDLKKAVMILEGAIKRYCLQRGPSIPAGQVIRDEDLQGMQQ